MEIDLDSSDSGSSDEEVEIPRRPSSVPLADGKKPEEVLQEKEKEKQIEQAIAKEAEIRANEPPRPLPRPPTPAVNAASAVKQAVKQTNARSAERAMNSPQTRATAAQRATQMKKLETMSNAKPPVNLAVHAENVRILNRYKEKFGQPQSSIKIDFKFNAMGYNTNMDPILIASERKQVETLLNSKQAPLVLQNLLSGAAGMIEELTFILAGPEHSVDGYEKMVTKCISEGFFDDELEQLAIILEPYLTVRPELRLAYKMYLVLRTVHSANRRGVPLDDVTINPELHKNTMDL